MQCLPGFALGGAEVQRCCRWLRTPSGHKPRGICHAARADPPEEIAPRAPGYSTCDRNSSPGMRKTVFLKSRRIPGAYPRAGGRGRAAGQDAGEPAGSRFPGWRQAQPHDAGETCERNEASAFRGKLRKRRTGVRGMI